LTFDEGNDGRPTWSPSGREITYRRQDDRGWSLISQAADGAGEPVVLVESERVPLSPYWSRDGRYLVYHQRGAETGSHDLRYLQLELAGDAAEPVTFLGSSANERTPRLSPDVRFVAYSSDESGRDEIYVRPFPDGAAKWPVSVNGGTYPRWRSDGKELYYIQSGRLMAVSVSTDQGFTLGQPQVLFEYRDLTSGSAVAYDVSADGQRFLTVAPVEDGGEGAPPKIRIVLNWYEEFRGREQ